MFSGDDFPKAFFGFGGGKEGEDDGWGWGFWWGEDGRSVGVGGAVGGRGGGV